MLIYNAQEDRYKVMADVRRGEHALKALGYAGWQRGALLATWAPLSKPLSKGERRQSPFRAAAFLGANGTVYETGPFHDVEALPAGVEVSAEGFVDVDGRFHSREQASQELQADHPVQSQELDLGPDLKKAEPGEPPTWIHGTSGQAIREAVKDGVLKPGNLNAKGRGYTQPMANHVYLTREPKVALKYADWKAHEVHKHPEAALAVVRPDPKKMVPDEDWLGKVVLHSVAQERSGGWYSDMQVHPLWERIKTSLAGHRALNAAMRVSDADADRVMHQARIGKRIIPALRERDPALLKELTDIAPSVAHEGPVPIISARVFPRSTRYSYRSPEEIQGWAGLGTELSVGAGLKKSQGQEEINNKSTLVKNNRGYMTDLSDYLQEQGNNSGKKIDRDNIQARLKDHQETLEAMASQQGQHLAFQVAAKMAGHPADAELRRAAELLHGDDVVSVALAAHGLNPKDEGLRMAVEAACQQLRLGKTEMNVAVLPRAVESGQQGADHMAMVIRQAFAHNLVYEVRLGGKHSAGTAIAYDQEGDRFWLLKPGSARVSPALGVSETGYNQSRREVAFNQACRAYEPMREYYPDCWLLLLDGQEVACMEVMGPGYRPAQKYGDAAELLEPYQDNLDLYRWAWWDYVLGNPDSHGGNILVTEDGRVALIDHGSSLAGPAFNPAADPRKSFIPYYLRVSSPDFAELNAEQRYHAFPHPTPDERETLKAWMRGLGDAWIQRLQALCPEATPACVRRADELLKEDDPADALLRSWAGVPAAESK